MSIPPNIVVYLHGKPTEKYTMYGKGEGPQKM